MTDNWGNPIAVGDKVAFIRTASGTRTLGEGTVEKLTPKGINVKHLDAYTPPGCGRGSYAFREVVTYRPRATFIKVAA